MLFRFPLLCLLALVACADLVVAQQPPPVFDTPEPEAASARQKLNEGVTPEEQAAFAATAEVDSIKAYRRFIKNNPASPLAMRAQYRIGQLYEAAGNSSRAFDAYQTLVTKYPDTPDFEKAVASQVVIANSYLEGKKVKFLGLPIVPGTDRAESMFASIINNAPFSKNAPIAQFNLGLTYERQGRVKEAASAYRQVLDRYPNSSIADDALYQIGYIYMRIGESGKSQDLSAVIEAKNSFEDFLLQYPSSPKAAQARDNMAKLSGTEAGDLMSIAKFYDRYKNYRAAAIYYNDVVRRSAGTEEARIAADRVQELRGLVGDDALRTGPENVETGATAALRRRLQAQVETSSLADFNGPPRRDIVADELPVMSSPRLRTESRDVAPMPAVEPTLPTP
jgi:outer membrane protein assembly factor BamD